MSAQETGRKRATTTDAGPHGEAPEAKRSRRRRCVEEMQVAPEEESEVPRLASDDILRRFMHPMPPSRFLEEHYRRQAVVVHASPTRTEGLVHEHLFDLDLEHLLENTASEHVFAWLRQGDGKIQSIEVPDSRSALVCHGAGGSLYFRCGAMPDMDHSGLISDFGAPARARVRRSSQEMADEYVAAMNQAVGMNSGGVYHDGAVKGEIEVFASRAGHVTDWRACVRHRGLARDSCSPNAPGSCRRL